ncbi:hypothetical protein GCM10027411_16540 [Microbacterium aureliae]
MTANSVNPARERAPELTASVTTRPGDSNQRQPREPAPEMTAFVTAGTGDRKQRQPADECA